MRIKWWESVGVCGKYTVLLHCVRQPQTKENSQKFGRRLVGFTVVVVSNFGVIPDADSWYISNAMRHTTHTAHRMSIQSVQRKQTKYKAMCVRFQ